MSSHRTDWHSRSTLPYETAPVASSGSTVDTPASAAWHPLRNLLGDYYTAFLTRVSQSVACNGLHQLEQRCCRWLVMTRDRVSSDDMMLTHEYLAIMLGGRRASVTEVLRPLQEAGLLRSRRGHISILDRSGLEARTCECYRIVKREYGRSLGNAPKRPEVA